MEVEKITDPKLYALKSSDTVALATEFLNSSGINGLPITHNGLLTGFVDLDSLNHSKAKQKIETLIKPNLGWVINENFHYTESLKRFSEFETDCLAIVSDENLLLGIVSKSSLINFLSQSYTIIAEGSVISLDMLARNYSLNELTRIIENEGAKIIGVTLFSIADSSRIQINLKLNTGFTDRIIQSLQRFGFEVTNTYYTNQDDSDVELRYQSLIKYLEL